MSQIADAFCKRCGRKPSLMGSESLYLVPYGSIYYVLCGSCMSKLCKLLKIEIRDLSNLFTHSIRYDSIILQYLRLDS